MRRAAVVTAVLVAVSGFMPTSSADIWTGSCALTLKFSFDSPVRSVTAKVLTAPGYAISATAGTCVVSLDFLNPLRSTSIGGGGSSVMWTCESVLGSGSWDQSWSPDPPAVSGFHILSGSWGAWTLVVNDGSLNFAGTISLTLHPLDAAKTVQCVTSGITSVRMTGVMVFEDPRLEPMAAAG